ncbi:head GIN domain-containing protein [Allomuricauda sp. XS_ASV26]|uniref:head GIN domain-containing protein n=1 Tax=Allomuricauda sp. XS_ASV26 TaxID=3241292 RepID=UPI003514FE6D
MRKRIIYVWSVVVLAFGISSCDEETLEASEQVSEKAYSFTGFNGINVTSAFKVFITFTDAEEERIVVEASDNLQDKMIVEQDGGILNFDLEKNTGIRGDIVLNVHITTPNLDLLNVSGVSEVMFENTLLTESFEMNVSDSGNVQGPIDVESMRLDLQGTSDVNLYGQVNTLQAKLNTSSDLKDYDLQVENLEIELEGLSETYVTVNGSLRVKASGTSRMNYKGDPDIVQKSVSGLAKVIKND